MLYLCYMIGKILNLLYPAHCHICNGKIYIWSKSVCDDCLEKIERRSPPFCAKCGRQLRGLSSERATCNDCMITDYYFDRAFSAASYNKALKTLVHNFKYKKMISLTKEFVELMLDFMREHGIGEETNLILSVPMHRSRLFLREINPSHILAKGIAGRLSIPYSDKFIRKIKNTAPQSRLTRYERIRNIKGSFSIRKNKIRRINSKNILLVDDLFTTGSTLNECARVLKEEAGARRVEALTLARGDDLL